MYMYYIFITYIFKIMSSYWELPNQRTVSSLVSPILYLCIYLTVV